ncbi:MAG: hypothetical protein ACLFPV_10370 [Spirochaetaceae bacterium]
MNTEDVLRYPGPGVPGDCYPRLSPVRRARGYRLYTDAGRVLDFWQAGGGAYLGHSPSGLGKALKAEIDRGLLATLPGWGVERLKAAMGALLPGWLFAGYADLSRAMAAISRIAGAPPSGVDDPALGPPVSGFRASGLPAAGAEVTLWRPNLEVAAPTEGYLLPILPGMHGTTAVLLGVPATDDRPPDDGSPGYGPLGPGDRLSPIDLALLTRGALLLARTRTARAEAPANEIPLRNPGTNDTLAPLWARRGAYLTPRCAKGDYDAMFDIYLKNGFYIAPRYPGPSILPAHCSPGEWSRFLEVTRDIARVPPA